MFLIKQPRSVEALHTYTNDLVINKIININKKGNIILPCGYHDTGENNIVF